jgi:hypothetical protein
MTQVCRVCACTNFSACAGGCWWVEDDLCSSCPPGDPGAQLIEDMKLAGLLEVRPEDVGKPWGEQRLVKTSLGEAHEAALRLAHPEWFPS